MKIFVHGLGQTTKSWEKTIKGLNKQEKIVCPELSIMLQQKDVSYTNLYEAFSKYCDNFIEPLEICGLSLGGILALQYAIDQPSKVHSLILIGTQYTMPKRLLQFQNTIFRFMPNSMFTQMGFGKKEFIELSKSMMELDFSKDLNKVSCPVLVLCGEKDNANKKAAEDMARLFPKADVDIIINSGHEVNLDKPEQLAEKINVFWEKLE